MVTFLTVGLRWGEALTGATIEKPGTDALQLRGLQTLQDALCFYYPF